MGFLHDSLPLDSQIEGGYGQRQPDVQMIRVKLPFGGVTPEQMAAFAAVAENYAPMRKRHITTRQDVQLHFVHIDDTPALMRRLAAVGITTREACGNTVRNVTACPIAGVCQDETFDVTPYARAAMQFLLGHPDAQDFGRKFKIEVDQISTTPKPRNRLDQNIISHFIARICYFKF